MKERRFRLIMIAVVLLGADGFANSIPFASIIRFPPVTINDTQYKDLACTDRDKANIHEIITTIAENGKFSLLLNHGHLKEIGAQIHHVHPLKFLTTIFSNPHLRSCMPVIFDDYFKRNGLLDGLGPSLSREADKGKLEQYIDEFAQEMRVLPIEIRPYFQNRDWENLVRFFIQS